MKSHHNWPNFLRPAGTFILILGTLLSLKATASQAETGASRMSFPEIEGWVRSPRIQIYTQDNLFDYINGAADLYLHYRFRELRVAEYRNPLGDLIAVEIYRHKTPVDAFGIYSQEQPPDPAVLDIGVRSYVQDTILNFLAGEYYVKISAYQRVLETQKILETFARGVADNLNAQDPEAERAVTGILACFPQDRKRLYSEQYVARNFLGYDFLSSGFTAEYADSNDTFRLFIVAGEDSADCRRMLSAYLHATEHPPAEAREGRHLLSDPYHGQVAISWRGQHIWGVLDLAQADLRDEYLGLIEELLIKHGFITP
jgi:hypothetical protein